MLEIPGNNGHPGMTRHFNKRKITGIRNCTCQGYRRSKDAISLYKGKNFSHPVFRERELLSSKHVSIFRKYPRIKDEYNIAIDNKVEDPGRGTER